MGTLGQEIRHAARRLWRAPTFTLAAAATLALAIGANVAIFTIVHRVVLNPLPYPDSHALVQLDHGAVRLNATEGLGLTSGLYFHYATRTRTLESIALHRTADLTLTGDGDPERLRVAYATPSLTHVLRVPPVLGRWFTEDEGRPGATQVAVLSHGLWLRRFGSDPGVLGRNVTLGGQTVRVTGVMPAAFAFPDPRVELWLAEQLTPASGFGLWTYGGVARLRSGHTLLTAREELNALIADLPAVYPDDARAAGNVEAKLFFAGKPLKDSLVGHVERGLWLLLASVGVVLLVACANVANLFLVRSDARQRDIAVRRALGAGGVQIARYFLTESLLLASIGGSLGLIFAWSAVRAVVAFGPPNLPRLHEIQIDPIVIIFTAAVTILAAVMFGILPFRRHDTGSSLHERGRHNTAGPRRQRARQVLMGAQVALAFVLLVASGLMTRSFMALRAEDPGFHPVSTLTFSIGMPERAYPTREAAVQAHHEIIERLTALPGVSAVSATSCLPLQGACFGNTVRVEGRSYQGSVPPIAAFRAIAGGYFETMGMRILQGRSVSRDDVERRSQVAVVSDALARRFFPGQNPIGQRIASNRPPARPGQAASYDWLEIIGVVTDTSTGRVLPGGPPLPQVYMPMSIAGGPGIPSSTLRGPDISVMNYVVRTASPPADTVTAARQAAHSTHPDLALAQITTLQDIVDGASARMAFTMTLLLVAAAVGLMLGIIGIYGVMSYVVSQRTGEIGVRLALGAEPRGVATSIVRQGAAIAALGVGVGLWMAMMGGRAIASLLYGISPRDPAVLLGATALLICASVLACWLPARRAARLSPVDALRSEG